jgi:hypothetical protein
VKQVDRREFLVVCSVLCLVAFIEVFMLGWIGFLVAEKGASQPPLWDVGHSNLPMIQGVFRFLFDIGLLVTLLLIIRGLFEDVSFLAKATFLGVIWGFVRILCTYVTVLGAPESLTPPPPITDLRSFWEEIKYGFTSRNILFFSGHVSSAILGAIMFSQHRLIVRIISFVAPSKVRQVIEILGPEPDREKISFRFFSRKFYLSTVFWFWALVMGFTVILTREHYTVDVVAALFMTFGIWVVAGGFIWQWLFKGVDRAADSLRESYKKRFYGAED